jgi:hypothetical protein
MRFDAKLVRQRESFVFETVFSGPIRQFSRL